MYYWCHWLVIETGLASREEGNGVAAGRSVLVSHDTGLAPCILCRPR